MSQANEYTNVQRKIEEWIADIPIDRLSQLIASNTVPLADATLLSCDDFIDNFLDRFVIDEENIARLHELYYYKSEERDQWRALEENVDTAASPYADIHAHHEYRQAKRAMAEMFTTRHNKGMFPHIEESGTDLEPDEQHALQCITDIHDAVDTVYEALEYHEHIQLDALFRTFCFKVYEVCATTMAEFARSDMGPELGIAVEPMKWFEQFLARYRTTLERLANEMSREPGQDIHPKPNREPSRLKKQKPFLH